MTAEPVHLGALTAAGRALQSLHSSLVSLRKQRDALTILSSRLATLTDEPRLPAQIPLGPYAAFPGQLVNTNTVLVHLGEDWHVEYSAKQARALSLRRKKAVDDQISQLEKEAAQLEGKIAEEAHLDSDLRIDEEGELLNEEGLPIMEITEPEEAALAQTSESEAPAHALVKAKRHVDWRKLADDLEEEDNAWLAAHADDDEEELPLSSTSRAEPVIPQSVVQKVAAPSAPISPPVIEATRPPSALKRRPSSAAKKVHFDSSADEVGAEASTSGTGATFNGIGATQPERPIQGAVVERPIKDQVVEKVIEPLTVSETAKGKQRATEVEEGTSRPILGAVTEKEAAQKPALAPDQALRDWMRLKTPEELAQVDSDDDYSDSDDSSTYHYDDEEELEAAFEQMDQMMLAREAALAYHRQRPDQVKAQNVERDEDLEDDQLVDEMGNLRYVNIGHQSRFRGGPNQTASLIIPALNAPREAEEPATDGDELDFFADAALNPEDRAAVRARLEALRDGIDPTTSSAPVVVDAEDARGTVKERDIVQALEQSSMAPTVDEGAAAPKKVSRFRARQAA